MTRRSRYLDRMKHRSRRLPCYPATNSQHPYYQTMQASLQYERELPFTQTYSKSKRPSPKQAQVHSTTIHLLLLSAIRMKIRHGRHMHLSRLSQFLLRPFLLTLKLTSRSLLLDGCHDHDPLFRTSFKLGPHIRGLKQSTLHGREDTPACERGQDNGKDEAPA